MSPKEIGKLHEREVALVQLKHNTAIAIRELLDGARSEYAQLDGDDADEDQFESDVLELVTGDQ